MEIVDMAWSLFTAVLGVVIGAWVVKRMMFSTDSIMEMADSVLEYLLTTKEGQKKLYTTAGFIGKGFRDGIGIKGGGGHRKLEDIIVEMGAQWFGKQFLGQKGEENPQQSSKLPWERD
jgi:hypothetical protein